MFKDVQKLVLNDDEDYGEDAYEEFIEEDLGSGSSTPLERFLSEHSSKVGSRQPSRDYNRPPQHHSSEMRPGSNNSELSDMTQDALYDDVPKFYIHAATTANSKPKLSARVQALQILEDSLADRIMSLGSQDPSTTSLWKKVVGEYNDVGLSVLSEGAHEPKLALSCVQRAMQLVEAKIGFGDEHDRKKMAAITLNNMSCMYYRMGCHKLALQHAERALRIEASSKKWDNPAVTHLNMAVILSKVCVAVCATASAQPHSISQLKRHEHAAQHCECALAVLEDGHVGSNSPTMQPPPGKLLLDSSVRAIAHFNLAVECEFLNQLDSAAHHYNMYALALRSLSPVVCDVDFWFNRSISVARSDCGAESATARTFESQALEALNDLAKKKRAKASKSSPEKIQPLVPKLDLSLVQVCFQLTLFRSFVFL